MWSLSELVRKIIHLRAHEAVQVTLLAVCPNSEAVLEAAVAQAATSNSPMLFAATLNQVDRDGGYKEVPRQRLQSGFFEISEEVAARLVQKFPVGLRPTASVREQPVQYLPQLRHQEIQDLLVQVGTFQRFIAEKEYPMERERLDVVWRRVVRSVPTYVFEVQVGGDVYHALGKLKHAYDIWNSRISLVGDAKAFQDKAEQLLSGTFHEIQHALGILDLGVCPRNHSRTGVR